MNPSKLTRMSMGMSMGMILLTPNVMSEVIMTLVRK